MAATSFASMGANGMTTARVKGKLRRFIFLAPPQLPEGRPRSVSNYLHTCVCVIARSRGVTPRYFLQLEVSQPATLARFKNNWISAWRPKRQQRVRRIAALGKTIVGLKPELAETHRQEAATAGVLNATSRSTFTLQDVLHSPIESALNHTWTAGQATPPPPIRFSNERIMPRLQRMAPRRNAGLGERRLRCKLRGVGPRARTRRSRKSAEPSSPSTPATLGRTAYGIWNHGLASSALIGFAITLLARHPRQ